MTQAIKMLNSIDAIGQIISAHRRKTKMSQTTLAMTAGVSRRVIQRLEKGDKNIQLDNLLKVFNVLNITVELNSPIIKTIMNENPHATS